MDYLERIEANKDLQIKTLQDLVSIKSVVSSPVAVSYTHLDVYKRQIRVGVHHHVGSFCVPAATQSGGKERQGL